jgi:6-phosphogluconolactonase
MLFIASPAQPPAIYSCTLNMSTGAFGPLTLAAENVRSGFLAVHPSKPILYAAASVKPIDDKTRPDGFVLAYRIDRSTGVLEEINGASTGDIGTTHLQVDPGGKMVAVCHYGGEGTSLLALAPDGSIRDSISRIRHEGSSVHPERQTRPHPHGVAFALDGRFVCVADLGSDHVEIFQINRNAKLQKNSFWKARPGAGPRHVSFHPTGKWLYCINEMDSTLSVLSFDPRSGTLEQRQTLTTLPEGFQGQNSTAEVVVHPSGRFLYGSNRGHDSTAVFQIDETYGTLALVEHEPTQGNHPRFVGLDPAGKIFIAANLNTNDLVSFQIDQKTGALSPTGHKLVVQRPMCAVFAN